MSMSASLILRGCRYASWTLKILSAILLFILFVQLVHLHILLHHLSPYAGLAYGLVVLAALLLLLYRVVSYRLDHQSLFPPALPPRPTFQELKTYSKYQIHLLKRLALTPFLTESGRKSLLQQAYDIDEILDHHPLLDDLTRSIERTRADFLDPARRTLRTQAETLTQERMHAVVKDVVEPPFPVVNSLVVLYYEVKLVLQIVDIYQFRAGFLEYGRAVRDVWQLITEGNFLKLGQKLFEGVYTNSPPMGRAVDDLGQALTSIWLTRMVSQAAILRCEADWPWTVEPAVRLLEGGTIDSLEATRESVIRDALPVLKLRIRHSAPLGVPDAAGFSQSVIDGIIRAIDQVIKTTRSKPPELVVAEARSTMHGTANVTWGEEAAASRNSSLQPKTPGVMRVLRTFGDRIKYGSGPRT